MFNEETLKYLHLLSEIGKIRGGLYDAFSSLYRRIGYSQLLSTYQLAVRIKQGIDKCNELLPLLNETVREIYGASIDEILKTGE